MLFMCGIIQIQDAAFSYVQIYKNIIGVLFIIISNQHPVGRFSKINLYHLKWEMELLECKL